MIILNVTAYQVFIMSFFQLEECVLLESLGKFHPNYSVLGYPCINIISHKITYALSKINVL